MSCGIIAYPITFLVTDLISEVYGQKRADLLVKVGFSVSVFVTLIIWIAAKAPIYEQSPVDEKSFTTMFGLLPGIVLGSMIAYLFAQFIDVRLFEFWRKLAKGRHLWLRNNGSTIISQLIDTVLVVTIALVLWMGVDGDPDTTPIDFKTWTKIVMGQYFFKLAIALTDTPLIYLSVWLSKRYLTQIVH